MQPLVGKRMHKTVSVNALRPSVPSVVSHGLKRHLQFEFQVENLSLKDELAALSHNQLMGGEQGMETLRLRNKFLQVRL
jgi:hypothetical protein